MRPGCCEVTRVYPVGLYRHIVVDVTRLMCSWEGNKCLELPQSSMSHFTSLSGGFKVSTDWPPILILWFSPIGGQRRENVPHPGDAPKKRCVGVWLDGNAAPPCINMVSPFSSSGGWRLSGLS
ncbi:hypothetical protein GWK47_031928 [Chionoecetes opilio]|uniref:Uncharacterized protein n=1 Tax=Chionoecetes opilio TaxID=41210 RepID=A0A8J5D0Z3_CHIOP|nr:hypothetical protein GWK47_031928 [Chionoecetes opilio]